MTELKEINNIKKAVAESTPTTACKAKNLFNN